MATVYGKINGRNVEEIVAYSRPAQAAIRKAAARRAMEASAILKAHRHDGDSRITVEHGYLDYYVVLNDERGMGHAMSIEFGRKGGNKDKRGNTVTHMDPVAPLRKAFDMPVTYGRKKGRA